MTGLSSRLLFVVAIVKGVIAVLLVLAACWCWICGIELPSVAVALLWAILGGYFGFSAHLSRLDGFRMKGVELLLLKDEGE